MKTYKPKFIETVKGLLIGFLIVVGTFPDNDWSFFTGIDSPLSWAFNYIYERGFTLGKDIVFPHGPLAFLMYPLAQNILIATLATALLKILLVFNIYRILEKKANYNWLIAFIIVYFIALISSFNQLIFANIILLYCNYYNREKLAYKLLAFVLTAFAFFIKSNIAIISAIVCASFLIYYLVRYRNFKKTAYDVLILVGLLFVIWFSMYGTFFRLVNYTVGMFHLAQDNSSAVAIYPYNNWWVLSPCLAILFLLPFIYRSEKSIFFGSIIVLSYFAVWKHGMAREDMSHLHDFLTYMMLSLLLFILFNPVASYKNIVLSIIAVFLFQFNMHYAFNYTPIQYKLFGTTNFTTFVCDYDELKAQLTQRSQSNISSNKLPQQVLDAIKDEPVDIYPWDYTFIAANNLNWRPRKVIQSYASYTSWLDNSNARHFKSKEAPAFMIWELNKKTHDLNGSDFNSIDYRYLLNDEPQTIVELIKNYHFFYVDTKVLVLKKRIQTIESSQSVIGKNNSSWGQWVRVPEGTNSLLRAKLTFSKTFLQHLKRFFYKDEQFWVYLKLQNEEIHRYRIVPENAKDGVWINPYIYNSNQCHSVKEIMFQCSNQRIMSDNLAIEWENINFIGEPNVLSNFFQLKELNSESTNLLSLNNFETSEYPYWNKLEDTQLSNVFYSGTKANVTNANPYSATFRYPLDSLSYGDLKLSADCWIKSPDYRYSKNISMVVTISDPVENVVYQSLIVDEQLIDQNRWNNVLSFVNYKHNRPNCTLGVYIWNSSGKDLLIDDFRIMVNHAKVN